jgi:hypothetical protein
VRLFLPFFDFFEILERGRARPELLFQSCTKRISFVPAIGHGNMQRGKVNQWFGERAIMTPPGEGKGTISVRCVGWTGVSAPLVKVLIDGQQVGILQDKLAHEFTATAGTHSVVVKRDFWRSLSLDVTVDAGVRSELECGFQIVGSVFSLQLLKLSFFLAFVVVLALVVVAGMPLWSLWVVLGAEAIAFGFVWWRLFIPPGAYLFLHPAPQVASGPGQKS